MKSYYKDSFHPIALVFTLFCLIIYASAALAADVTVLRFAGSFPIGHHCTRGQELYAKLIMEKTNKVKIEVYPASQLFVDKDIPRAISSGSLDMGILTPGVITGQVPLFLMNDIPFIFKDRAHVHRWIDSEASDIFRDELEKKGYHLLYWIDFSSFGLATTKPIKALEDFKGKRIRGMGEMAVEGLRALGAAPTFISSGEVYLALQRNTIDGGMSGWTTFYDRKYYEVAKYLTDPGYTLGVMVVGMNRKIWDRLPKDVQETVMAAGKEAQAWGRKECEKKDVEALEQLKKMGMEYYVVPEKERERWKAAATPTCTEIFLKRIDDRQKGNRLMEIAERLRGSN